MKLNKTEIETVHILHPFTPNKFIRNHFFIIGIWIIIITLSFYTHSLPSLLSSQRRPLPSTLIFSVLGSQSFSLLPIHHSLFIIHHSFIHHSLFTIHYSPFIIHHSLFTIHHSPFTIKSCT